MKILYLITKSNLGGAQRYVLDLSKMAKNKGFEVVVGAGGEGELKQKIESLGLKFITIKGLDRNINFFKDLKSIFSVWKVIKEEKPDVVHFNSSKMGLGILIARIQKLFFKYPKNIIFTAHGWPFNEPRSYWQIKIIWILSWFSVLFSNITITIASFDFEKTKKMPFVKKKVVYIPNGIGEIIFLDRDTARENLTSISSYKFGEQTEVGTVAELTKNKGLKYLVETAERARDLPVHFFIIGDGEDKEKLENMIRERGLQNKITLSGKIDEARKYLKAFDIFLLPSVKEGLPYVLLEAGLAKLPVIATSVGGIPEVIEDMKTGILVRKKDPHEIETAIRYVLENKENADVFKTALKEKVANNFNLDNMAEETFKLYNK
ncbi:MAG: glycosyltransferase [Patescibacteria group bacterium]